MDTQDKNTTLANSDIRVSFFDQLSESEITFIDRHSKLIEVGRNENIFKEDAQPFALYCLFEGKVKLYKTGDEGREQIVRFANTKDIIGYRALLSGDNYRCSASAIVNSTLLSIPKEVIDEVFDRNLHMYKVFLKLLANDLRQAEVTITDLAQKPVRERVAECILLLKETYGVDNEDYINVKLSREEMANIVGTATETVIRLLSEFKKDGIIEMDIRRIRVLDEEKLIRTARM